jgi:N-acetyl-anhydromuramyl-L-alanine amidase AmpD
MSCGAKETVATLEDERGSISATEPSSEEIITVYPEAREEYLLPEDDFSRPRTEKAEFVMIHFTSAVVASREDPYNMETVRSIFEDYQLSVHYIIDRDGVVSCYVPEDRVAWHAGKGTWNEDEKYTDKLNEYAIGIELVAIGSENDMAQYLTSEEYDLLDDSLKGFTDAQYDSLSKLVEDICSRNNIPFDRDHVIGHEEYSPAKTDPGELFDWDRLIK